MKIVLLIILILIALTIAAWYLIYPQWVHAYYPNGAEFTGIKPTVFHETEYFSIRVIGQDKQPISNDCSLIFHWQGNQMALNQITPESLAAIGIKTTPKDYGGPSDASAFIGDSGNQNRNYGVEFHFRSGKLIEFYARHSYELKAAECPFGLSLSEKKVIHFPIKQNELIEIFGEPSSIKAARGT